VVTIAISLDGVRHRRMLHLRYSLMLRVKELEILDFQKSKKPSDLQLKRQQVVTIATSLNGVWHRRMLHLRAMMLRVKELEILDLQKPEETSDLQLKRQKR
jgi:hypothetical protein